ncbi:MAG: arginase family protein [Chloroflexota bacterium]
MPRYTPEDSLQSPRFTDPSTFARLALIRTLEDVDVAIVGVPFDTGVTYRTGGRFGPNAVRTASVMLRPYNANLDVKPFDLLSCVDYGDVSMGVVGSGPGDPRRGAPAISGLWIATAGEIASWVETLDLASIVHEPHRPTLGTTPGNVT